jgi:alpha-tubulin suppressor-like RCC1 family protein
VVNGTDFESLGLGGSSCGVRTGGGAWCWCNNNSGELGDCSNDSRTIPVAVMGGQMWERVNAGVFGDHNCGLTTAGAVYCWGRNHRGQLGNGTTEPRSIPAPIEGL